MAYFNLNEAYRILGIEPGSDINEVKKAYASLIKQYHPEENPDEWKKIHDAYTLLCKFLKVIPKTSGTEGVVVFDNDDIPEKAGFSEEAEEEQFLLDSLLDEARKEKRISTSAPLRRAHIGRRQVLIGPFPPILHKKIRKYVKYSRIFLYCLDEKSLAQNCFARKKRDFCVGRGEKHRNT